VTLRVKTLALIGLGLALVWLVITRSLPAFLSVPFPDAARVLQPDNTAALIGQSDRLIGRDARTDANVQEAADLLRRALIADPVNAGILQRLGDISAGRLADAFMEAAARLSLHESLALYRTMQIRLQAGDRAGALRFADALLRTRPDLIEGMAPTMDEFAKDVSSRDHLVRLLAGNPPWRTVLLTVLPRHIGDPSVMLALLTDLEPSAHPATTQEVNAFLNLLAGERLYELAHYAWLQFLRPEQLASVRLLFNGDFAYPPSGALFDWKIVSGAGVVSEIVRHPHEEHRRALRLTFGEGRVVLGEIGQTVVLPEGDYEMRGREMVTIGGTRRGLLWRITCADSGKRLGESPAAVDTGGWMTFAFSFTVPAQDCPAQHVRLVRDDRLLSDPFATGTAWYSDLRITRR
jgi:hypothetical protein